jgi:hypothetical protein
VLPAYMIPTYVTMVEAFPLTTNGKIDKAALPSPASQLPAAHIAPATLIETMLADMYATLLVREQVGAADSFFDLGGSSLQVMRLISMMADDLRVSIDVSTVFLAPTPRQLAALLRDKHGFDDADLVEESIAELQEVADEQTATILAPSDSG